MFAQTQDLEFGQGQSRDVPDRELALNITTRSVMLPNVGTSLIPITTTLKF